MLENVPRIRVVAALIENHGRFLITQRRTNATLGGLWEFPSGKVQKGESDEGALQRELRERVGVDVSVGKVKARRIHRYDGYQVELVLYNADLSDASQPKPIRVADLRWVLPAEIENYPFPPADQETMDKLLGLKHDQNHSAKHFIPALVA